MYVIYACRHGKYDNKLTSVRLDSAILQWREIGLFNHLSESELTKAIDDAELDNRFSINNVLMDFPGVVYSLNSDWTSQHSPYGNLLSHLARITHGAFNPTGITQTKVKGGVKLKYLFKGKIHSFTFLATNDWFGGNFSTFMKRLCEENNLSGNFYTLQFEDSVIYLSKQQHDYIVMHKLLDLAP